MRSPFEKIVKGIVQYSKGFQPALQKRLTQLHDAHPPPAISACVLTCMDARIDPALLTQTQPREMFVLRNPGNIIRRNSGIAKHAFPEVAGLELTTMEMGLKDFVVCGHSNCLALKGHMIDQANPEKFADKSCAHNFLMETGNPSYEKLLQAEKDGFNKDVMFNEGKKPSLALCKTDLSKLSREDQLSHIHCLQQIEHALSYDWMHDLVVQRKVRVHAMWFDVHTAAMFYYSNRDKEFLPFTQISEELMNEVNGDSPPSLIIN